MALYINSNISSMISQRYLNKNINSLSTSLERLSSGYKINHAADDAAGLALSENLRTQLNGKEQAVSNIQDGVNMLQIAEGGLSLINDNIQRIRSLTVQSANGTYGTTERLAMKAEIEQRLLEITRIANTTTYNNIPLLNSTGTSIVLQIAASSDETSTLDIKPAFTQSTATALGITLIGALEKWNDPDAMRGYLDTLDAAITQITSSRSMIGAYQNRIECALENINIMQENLQDSDARIRETDIAEEASNLAKNQILEQASASVLMQANQLNAVALQILQG